MSPENENKTTGQEKAQYRFPVGEAATVVTLLTPLAGGFYLGLTHKYADAYYGVLGTSPEAAGWAPASAWTGVTIYFIVFIVIVTIIFSCMRALSVKRKRAQSNTSDRLVHLLNIGAIIIVSIGFGIFLNLYVPENQLPWWFTSIVLFLIGIGSWIITIYKDVRVIAVVEIILLSLGALASTSSVVSNSAIKDAERNLMLDSNQIRPQTFGMDISGVARPGALMEVTTTTSSIYSSPEQGKHEKTTLDGKYMRVFAQANGTLFGVVYTEYGCTITHVPSSSTTLRIVNNSTTETFKKCPGIKPPKFTAITD